MAKGSGGSGKRRVAVIGAGVSGLVAARVLSDHPSHLEYVVFEQSGRIGGTWVYTERTGVDEFGVPIHTSMYKNLRTNLPKECMMFPDFPHTKQGVSYLSNAEVLQYLESYADHFNLRPHIKTRHSVKEVKPEGEGWKVHVKDVQADQDLHLTFDSVIITSGQYSTPRYPQIKGLEDNFRGRVLHSHNYREPTPFKGQRVLIIGAGPSGLDLTFDLSTVTDHVTMSHHTDYAGKVGFPPKVTLKPDVREIDSDGMVVFVDGSKMEFDIIALCTGYLYNYPYLRAECGLTIDDNYISPLYKYIVNVNRPTMGLIGLLKHTPTFYIVDLQVRFFVKTLLQPELLPSREAMLSEIGRVERRLAEKGVRKRDYFVLAERNEAYMRELSAVSGAEPMPPILLRIFHHGYDKIFSDFKNFRNNFYRIVDEDTFTVVDLREINAKPVQRIHDNPACRCGNVDATREIY